MPPRLAQGNDARIYANAMHGVNQLSDECGFPRAVQKSVLSDKYPLTGEPGRY
jgi:hypothetical protein